MGEKWDIHQFNELMNVPFSYQIGVTRRSRTDKRGLVLEEYETLAEWRKTA
jgi:hypothetical protein